MRGEAGRPRLPPTSSRAAAEGCRAREGREKAVRAQRRRSRRARGQIVTCRARRRRDQSKLASAKGKRSSSHCRASAAAASADDWRPSARRRTRGPVARRRVRGEVAADPSSRSKAPAGSRRVSALRRRPRARAQPRTAGRRGPRPCPLARPAQKKLAQCIPTERPSGSSNGWRESGVPRPRADLEPASNRFSMAMVSACGAGHSRTSPPCADIGGRAVPVGNREEEFAAEPRSVPAGPGIKVSLCDWAVRRSPRPCEDAGLSSPSWRGWPPRLPPADPSSRSST